MTVPNTACVCSTYSNEPVHVQHCNKNTFKRFGVEYIVVYSFSLLTVHSKICTAYRSLVDCPLLETTFRHSQVRFKSMHIIDIFIQREEKEIVAGRSQSLPGTFF